MLHASFVNLHDLAIYALVTHIEAENESNILAQVNYRAAR